MDNHLTLDQLRSHLYAVLRDAHKLKSTDRHYSWMDAALDMNLDQLEGAEPGVPHLWWVTHEKLDSTGTALVPLTSWGFVNAKATFKPGGALHTQHANNELTLRVLLKTPEEQHICKLVTSAELDALVSAVPLPTYTLQIQRFDSHEWENHAGVRVAEEGYDTLEEILAEELALHPDPHVQTIRAMNASADDPTGFLMWERKPDYDNPRRVVT